MNKTQTSPHLVGFLKEIIECLWFHDVIRGPLKSFPRAWPLCLCQSPSVDPSFDFEAQKWSHGSLNGKNSCLCSNIEGYQGGANHLMSQGVRLSSFVP